MRRLACCWHPIRPGDAPRTTTSHCNDGYGLAGPSAPRTNSRVFCTSPRRARERLWIVCHALAGEQDELRPPPTGTLLEPLWPAITDMTSEASARVRTATDAAPEAPSQAPITYLTRIARPPPAAAEVAIRVEEGVAGPEEFEFEWVTASARHVGTVVHEELERVASGRLALQTAWGAREPHWRRRLRELGVDRDRLDDAVARTARALERTAADPRGRWILSTAHQDASCELGLSTLQQGAVRAARIDRSFIDDGVRWIIDFKTSLHEGGDLESFIDREKERYRAQLEHYAALLRARDGTATIRLGLYFPLHAAWREWLAPTSPG
jgi:ATP-dependent exoDNAse (exonuclease V) beta subunit